MIEEWAPDDLERHSTIERVYKLPWPFTMCVVRYFVLDESPTRLNGWRSKTFYDLMGRVVSMTEERTGKVFDAPAGQMFVQD